MNNEFHSVMMDQWPYNTPIAINSTEDGKPRHELYCPPTLSKKSPPYNASIDVDSYFVPVSSM